MEHAAEAGPFLALEKSAWGDFVRQSPLLYPIANTLHVLAVMSFFAAVAAMDARLLGWFRGVSPAAMIARFRPIAVAALCVVIATGFTLFTPEASAIIRNTAFRLKMLAIVLALLNVAWLEARVNGRFGRQPLVLDHPDAEVPDAVRRTAFASLALWLFVAACGRFIAYA